MPNQNQIVSVQYDGFLDSFENLDFEKGGRVMKHYVPWNGEDKRIGCRITLDRQWCQGKRFREVVLNISFSQEDIPDEIEVELEQRGEFGVIVPGHIKTISIQPDQELKLFITLKSNDPYYRPTALREVSFELEITGKGVRRFGRKIPIPRTKSKYELAIGQDLGNTWVSFDPGTTGSCIAVGSETTVDKFNITVQEEEGGEEKIMPSVIGLNLASERASGNWRDDTLFKSYCYVGEIAKRNIGSNDIKSFQSVKKLLGFKDEQTVTFHNGVVQSYTGVELTQIICQELYDNLQSYIENNSNNKEYEDFLDTKGEFNPKRAIVAVPNNFTLSKIKDMVNSIEGLGQFHEIRYITEAEAVLCYYLYNHDQFSESQDSTGLEDETILVFDMGGATINTTIADLYIPEEQGLDISYEMLVDAKIGYGIGGDTIDYCLAKYFFSRQFTRAYPVLREFDPFSPEASSQLKGLLSDLLLQLKILLIKGYESKKPVELVFSKIDKDGTAKQEKRRVLARPTEISDIFNSFLSSVWAAEKRTGSSPTIRMTADASVYQAFISNQKGDFPFFQFDLFKKYIYQPVQESITDVLDLSERKGVLIDTVILSGRSVLFPKVQEIIEQRINLLKKKDQSDKTKRRPIHLLQGKDLKTAVCKGACWFAINKGSVNLSPSKVTSNLGFKRTLKGTRKDIEFTNLIPAGGRFEENSQQTKSIRSSIAINSRFELDGRKVVFYQIMGVNPQRILQEGQQHKFSRIHDISLPLPTTKVVIQADANDQVTCAVHTVDGKVLQGTKLIEPAEVKDENEEHYTWLLS